jgi:hypothetical protein
MADQQNTAKVLSSPEPLGESTLKLDGVRIRRSNDTRIIDITFEQPNPVTGGKLTAWLQLTPKGENSGQLWNRDEENSIRDALVTPNLNPQNQQRLYNNVNAVINSGSATLEQVSALRLETIKAFPELPARAPIGQGKAQTLFYVQEEADRCGGGYIELIRVDYNSKGEAASTAHIMGVNKRIEECGGKPKPVYSSSISTKATDYLDASKALTTASNDSVKLPNGTNLGDIYKTLGSYIYKELTQKQLEESPLGRLVKELVDKSTQQQNASKKVSELPPETITTALNTGRGMLATDEGRRFDSNQQFTAVAGATPHSSSTKVRSV